MACLTLQCDCTWRNLQRQHMLFVVLVAMTYYIRPHGVCGYPSSLIMHVVSEAFADFSAHPPRVSLIQIVSSELIMHPLRASYLHHPQAFPL